MKINASAGRNSKRGIHDYVAKLELTATRDAEAERLAILLKEIHSGNLWYWICRMEDAIKAEALDKEKAAAAKKPKKAKAS